MPRESRVAPSSVKGTTSVEIGGQQVPAINPAAAQVALERARAAAAGLRAQTAAGAQLASGASATTRAPVNAQFPVSVPRPGTTAAARPATGAAAATQAQQQAAIQAQQQAAAEQEIRIPRLKLRRNATMRDVLVAIAAAMNDPQTSKAGAARLQALHEQLLDIQRQSMSLWTRGY